MDSARRIPAAVVLSVLAAFSPCAFALNPALDIFQYTHKAWTVREGFFKGSWITAIAQTPDGYLWLGTELGIVRFDGVRFVQWEPPSGEHLPSNQIRKLLVSRDGRVWIGTRQGLASWKDGKVNQHPELDGQAVGRLLEDHEGTVWVGSWGVPTGRLCAIQNDTVHCYGQDGVLGRGVWGLHEDTKRNLWVGVSDGLWRWIPGPSRFYPMPGESDAIRAFIENDNHELLISTRKGIKRFVDGKTEAYPPLENISGSRGESMLRDRDGGLWISTSDRGLIHVHQSRADVFAHNDGLSDDEADRKSTRLNSSHSGESRMPSSA